MTEGRHVMTNGEGRVQDVEKREQFTPPPPLKQKQRILDVKTVNLIQVGFRQPHLIQLWHIFVCQLTSQTPMSAPSWVCMMLRAPHTHTHPNHHEETPQKLICSPALLT